MTTLVVFLPALDVDVMVKWYTIALGFKLDTGEKAYVPGSFAYMYLGGSSAEESRALIMLKKYPDPTHHDYVGEKPAPWHLMFDLTDRQKGKQVVDEKYEEVKASGLEVSFKGTVEDKPWGVRQFDVRDPEGHLLSFYAYLT